MKILKSISSLLAIAGLSGCAVYPAPSYDTYYGSPVVGSPYVVEQQPVYLYDGNGGGGGGGGGAVFVSPNYGLSYPRPYYPQGYGNPRDYDGRPPGMRPGPPPNGGPGPGPGGQGGPGPGPGFAPRPPPPVNGQAGPRPGPRPGDQNQGPGPRPGRGPDQHGDGVPNRPNRPDRPDRPDNGDGDSVQPLYPNGMKPGHH